MIFALNYPAAKHWMEVVEQLPPARGAAVKSLAAAPICGLLYWWYTRVFALEKVRRRPRRLRSPTRAHGEKVNCFFDDTPCSSAAL